MRFPCPECGAMLKGGPDLVGKRLACPKCKNLLTVPAAEDTPAGASPALSLVDPAQFGANGGHVGVDARSPPQTNSRALGPGMPSHLGRYRLVRELGRGGMGIVYDAVQEGLDRRVAVKILFRHWTDNREFVVRFQREARAAAALDHPNIVTVHDIGEDRGFHFFSMALVDGESLDRRVKREGKLPVPEALGLIIQAVEGLTHAWERGIIHRDIKPANLLVTQAGVLKIADFGIAKAATTESLGLTQTGASLGTPHYASPEQSANAGDVDFRADEYSLGATFYHLVTGRVPFAGSSPVEVAVKAATAPLPPVRSVNPDVPPKVAEVIEKMLARHKEDRYGTTLEVVDTLHSVRRRASVSLEKPNGVKVRAPERPCGHRTGHVRDALLAAASAVGARAVREWVRRYGIWFASGCMSVIFVAVLVWALVRQGNDHRLTSEPALSGIVARRSHRPGQLPAPPESRPVKPNLNADPARDITAAVTATQSTVGVPTPAAEPPPKAETQPANIASTSGVANGPISPLARGQSNTGVPTSAEKPSSKTETQLAKPGSSVAAVTGIAPSLAVAPFDATAARRHQNEWARHLARPVEVTNSIGMKLVLIPPGEFLMGSPHSDADSLSEEKPQHRVRITRPFYLGAYEVTQGEYERVMGANPSWFTQGGSGAAAVSGKNTSRHPVEWVSWEDAVEFCRKVSALPEEQRAGRTYRLLTEAEWEYVCRAGVATRYGFGDDAARLGEYAWFTDNYGGTTHPVGQKKPNAWGLYDMHGNVWEWCQDWYDATYYATRPAEDPTGPLNTSDRVHRGGGWHSFARDCRSADRRGLGPSGRDYGLGFRVGLVPPGR